jgi:hypothetical protein
MEKLNMTDTKWNIFITAMDMFSERGYNDVSLREIAEKVSIKASSIYNHFQNKDQLLLQMYKFYEKNYFVHIPNLKKIVSLIGKMHPHDILKSSIFFYDSNLQVYMDKIILIALNRKNYDKNAENLVRKIFFKMPKKIFTTLLSKMIESEVIEPLNIENFITVATNYNYAAASRRYSKFAMSFQEWHRGREFILELIHTKPN